MVTHSYDSGGRGKGRPKQACKNGFLCTTAIMITTSNSTAKVSGMPNYDAGDLLRTLAISGLSSASSRIYSQARLSFGSSLLAVFFRKAGRSRTGGHDD